MTGWLRIGEGRLWQGCEFSDLEVVGGGGGGGVRCGLAIHRNKR